MKLSKTQIKNHEDCLRILDKEDLTLDEKLFVYQHWSPSYDNQIATIASYFTPFDLAYDFTLCFDGDSVVDLCAGLGILSFMKYHYFDSSIRFTCVEKNAGFVEVGKKLFPEAKWIFGDVLDETLVRNLGKFDSAISNPPFGKIKSNNDKWLKYKGSEFDYKVIEVAGILADAGAFILPQGSVPFIYSGESAYRERENERYLKFKKETRISLDMNIGIDCSIYRNDWKGTNIKTEIACFEKRS